LKQDAEKSPGEVVGSGKDAGKPPGNAAPKGGPAASKEDDRADARPPTPQDVEHLKDLMQQKNGIGDMAARALEQMSKEAPDPKVREQAKQALAEAGTKQAPADSAGPTDPKASTNEKSQSNSTGKANQATNNPKGKTPEDGDPAKRGASGKPATGDNPGISGNRPSSGTGVGGDTTPDAVRKDLSRFGGNLQLEDFLKRATPEFRAKHGITDAEWQRLLANAAEYDALLRKSQHSRSKLPTDGRATGIFGSSGPSEVQRTPSAHDGVDSGRAEVPPELRQALERLQRGPR
jgi:hypothetical protein